MIQRPDEAGVGAIQVQGGFAGDPIPHDPASEAGIPGEYTTESVDLLDTPATDPVAPGDDADVPAADN